MTDPTVIAVDWSGAKGEGRHPGIWLAAINAGGERSQGRWARREVIDEVAATPGPLIVGFDFSFGLPAWYARQLGCETIDAVWRAAEDVGEGWIEPPALPFWKDAGMSPPAAHRFRRCEEQMTRFGRAQPTSVFQLVGASQVGKGSVRGMPHLRRLREEGFAIWPFDDPSDRTVVEIYPAVLRRHSPQHDLGPWKNIHERDAVASARVMWDARETVTALRAATDPTTRLEGEIWAPTPPQN